MPHPRRAFVAGLSVHVYQRAHNKIAIFTKPDDCEAFVELVRQSTVASGIDVHAFVVMTTHYHLLLTPHSSTALPRAMKRINGGYVRYFNRKCDRLGTLWNGRYKSRLIEDERYWLTCLRYIEYNPVEARMVADPAKYPWSSYAVHAHGAASVWLASHHVFEALGATPAERQAKYREFGPNPLPADFALP